MYVYSDPPTAHVVPNDSSESVCVAAAQHRRGVLAEDHLTEHIVLLKAVESTSFYMVHVQDGS
jgi:hypothetical protein